MKYFGKYPIFYTLMIVLSLVFVGGIGADFYFNTLRVDNSKKLSKEMRDYRKALAADPTAVAIEKSAENIKKLEMHLKFLEKDLTRASGDIFKPTSATKGYELVEELRGMVNRWRKTATNLGIVVEPSMDFGYQKYVAPNAQPPRDAAVQAVWKQACVLNYINEKLFKSKSAQSPMWILSEQREVLPEEIEKVAEKKKRGRTIAARQRDNTIGDNFKIDPLMTARKDGSLDTIAFRFVFAGHTDVLRRFLNQLKNFDAMLVVRSIVVKPAEMGNLPTLESSSAALEGATPVAADAGSGNLDSIFGSAPKAPEAAPADASTAVPPVDGTVTEDNRTPIVTDNISEFTVVIEFVEVVKDQPKSDNGESADENNSSVKKSKTAKK